ncbi:Tubulin-specific chaperone cofactor E-like protein [Hypsibius exemplaris]|uniref:Tubulin-specific chaperone cofactor E-like protein n=1 Tax=Hypsibius exemplaris TaxID=2072580 RepID=A0A1W0WZL9_HYPEX|nr:Tubulin-specific chaperone cofactor E-like protein [Hypsibius exemplaris]
MEEPMTFLTALEQKYSDEDYRVLFGSLICQERERQDQENSPASPEKRRNFMFPPYVVLQNFGIGRVEPSHQLAEWCVHLTEIDLSFNRINKWNEVLPLIQGMPALESLNLSFNPLKDIRLEDITPHQHHHHRTKTAVADHTGPLNRQIKRLILNGTLIDWPVVIALLRLVDGVEELHLSLNGYSELQSGTDHDEGKRSPSKVKELHVDGNQLASWETLMVIGGVFPALQTLFASQNPLCDLQKIENDALRSSFPALKKLHVNQIELEEWDALDKLNSIANLTDLRLLGTKLWANDTAPVTFGSPTKKSIIELTPRSHVIARLPNVQILNGTAVETLERMDAERAFLRHFHSQSPAPIRYPELEAKYGHLKPLAHVDLGAPVFVAVSLTTPTFSKRPYRVNVKQSVAQLKKSLTAITGLSPSKCRVFYWDAELAESSGLEELKYPGRALHSYAIVEGDEIIVQEK